MLGISLISFLSEWDISQSKDIFKQVSQLECYGTLLSQILLEGDTHEEFKELNELHVLVFISIIRLIDYSHLSQIKLHPNCALR